LAQELRWIAWQSRPEILAGYRRLLPKRYWSFGPEKRPLRETERQQLDAAVGARLAELAAAARR
jgi:hypothetical protein